MGQFGAICDRTKLYTMPLDANKVDTYSCVKCKERVRVKQGEIRAHHFSHCRNSNCTFYNYEPSMEGGGETEFHINAKYRLQSLLETQHQLTISSYCVVCHEKWESTLPILTEDMKIVLEHPMTHNGDSITADMACVQQKNIPYIIEILYSHQTEADKRPEPWYELHAMDILNHNSESKHIRLKCCREVCLPCFQYVKMCEEQRQREKIVRETAERLKLNEEWRVRVQQEEEQRIRLEEENRIRLEEEYRIREKRQEEERRIRLEKQEEERVKREVERVEREAERVKSEAERVEREAERAKQAEEERLIRIKKADLQRRLEANRKSMGLSKSRQPPLQKNKNAPKRENTPVRSGIGFRYLSPS
jgi:hypothetical protein